MLPNNSACQPITYITSKNLIRGLFEEALSFQSDGVKCSTLTPCVMSLDEGATDNRSLANFQNLNPASTLPMVELTDLTHS